MVLVRTASKIFSFLEVKFSICLNRRVFVMVLHQGMQKYKILLRILPFYDLYQSNIIKEYTKIMIKLSMLRAKRERTHLANAAILWLCLIVSLV